jgi:hypothetical protein
MSTVEAPSILFAEIATLFASGPSRQNVLDFRPSDAAIKRASELLELNRQDRLDDELRHELDQYTQAELLMRLVKARIRADQVQDERTS